jgi:hypothetical protein
MQLNVTFEINPCVRTTETDADAPACEVVTERNGLGIMMRVVQGQETTATTQTRHPI